MVSTMNGPIPPHPYYDKSSQSYNEAPAPRVRPEAQDNYERGQGNMKFTFEVEGHRAPSTYTRNAYQSKNHMKDNMRRLRNIQRQTKAKEETNHQPVKALWKSSKYDHVGSRIQEDLHKDPDAPRPRSATYLRAHSRTGFIPMSARPASTEPPEEKLTVPTAQTAREVRLNRNDIDFIKVNGRGVKNFSARRSPSASALDELKDKREQELATYRKGEVPSYLRKRQETWRREEEDRIANAPDPDLPPGHRMLPQEERKETLAKLQKSQSELLERLRQMPVRTDTTKIRRQKQEIDEKLSQLEEAIRIFSRPKVFVKLDN